MGDTTRRRNPHDHRDSQDHNDYLAGPEYPDYPEEGADTGEGASAEVIDAEVLIHRRPSVRKRAVQVGLAFLCVLAVFGVFHAITPAATRIPAPAPHASKSRSEVAIAANLSFGSVIVDGKKLVGEPSFEFSAAPGGDLVTYSAPPFLARSCRVFWIGSGGDASLGTSGSNCEMNIASVRVSSWVSSWNVLTFGFGLRDLPPSYQATALSFVRKAITPASLSLAVPSGQYYATGRDGMGMILSRQATTPLTAIVSLLLPTPQDLATSTTWCSEPICPALSTPGGATPISRDQLWVVQIPLVMSWLFLLQIDTLLELSSRAR